MRLPASRRCLGGSFAGGGMGRVRPRCWLRDVRCLREEPLWVSCGIPHGMGGCEQQVQHDLLILPDLNPGAEHVPESPSILMGRTRICWDYSVLREGLGNWHRRVSRPGGE